MTAPAINRALRQSRRTTGFTVLESLGIAGIGSILFAIIVPSYTRSSNRAALRAQRDECRGNLLRIGLGFKLYYQDYDLRFPATGSAADAPDAWALALHDYINYRDLRCPSDPDPLTAIELIDPLKIAPVGATRDKNPRRPSLKKLTAYAGDNNFTDYWYNSRLATANIKALIYPANTILAGDGSGQPGSVGFRIGTAGYVYDGCNFPTKTASPTGSDWQVRHLGGANYAFADGHVAWLEPKSIAPTATKPASSNSFSFMIS